MDSPRIQDIPSIKKTLDDAKQLKSLKAVMPILKPLLRLIGVEVNEMDSAFANLDELDRQAKQLAALPDRFNELFGTRGWIIYDLMNFEVANAAVAKAEAGDVDGAEEDLIAYYKLETVEWLLRRMVSVRAFIARMPLAEKALIDYREVRYHACVPVVLALLDGLVNELHEKHRGYFAEDANLTAWDSVAAHDKGLNELKKIFQIGRYTTITEQITVPYRNGILNGMDLGYDNKTVAAKTWAALFWKARNYGRMAQSLHLYGESPNAAPQRVRENYALKKLSAFEFLEITDTAAAVTTIKAKLIFEEHGSEIERVVDFRLVNEGPDGRGALRGKPDCTWIIYPFYL